jgi:hypothetical protein
MKREILFSTDLEESLLEMRGRRFAADWPRGEGDGGATSVPLRAESTPHGAAATLHQTHQN